MATKSSAAGDTGFVASPSLTLKRRLNAPPAKVWAAWTDPEKIVHWFGPAQTEARLGARRARRPRRRPLPRQLQHR